MVLHNGKDGVNSAEDTQSHDSLVLIVHILITLKNPDEYFSLPNTDAPTVISETNDYIENSNKLTVS